MSWPIKAGKVLELGTVYGRWKVVGISFRTGYAAVQCVCGTSREVQHWQLTSGKSTSCGCYLRELVTTQSTTHGLSGSPEYKAYHSMLKRCSDPKLHNSHRYAGRGITVSEDWLICFENFYRDMGDKPSPSHQLDRIDNDLGYSADNCRWVTPKENARNRDNSIYVSVGGQEITLKDLAVKLNIKYLTLYWRYCKGYQDEDEELCKPLRKRKENE